jgi:ankyrin repeat protein
VRVSAVKTAMLLLEQGASLQIGDSQGQAALHHASRNCNLKMMQNLIAYDRKSQVNLVDNSGNSALHLVCASTHLVLPKAVFFLLENGLDANLRNQAGQTPLHILCANQRCPKEALRHFADHGARLYEQDRNQVTALHVACHLNNREVACELVRLGALLCVPDAENKTPLDVVAPGFAVQLLHSVATPPDLDLAKRLHRLISGCMICKSPFKWFSQKKHCPHCARVVCYACCSKSFPVLKFRWDTSVPLCTHCFEALALGSNAPQQAEEQHQLLQQ